MRTHRRNAPLTSSSTSSHPRKQAESRPPGDHLLRAAFARIVKNERTANRLAFDLPLLGALLVDACDNDIRASELDLSRQSRIGWVGVRASKADTSGLALTGRSSCRRTAAGRRRGPYHRDAYPTLEFLSAALAANGSAAAGAERMIARREVLPKRSASALAQRSRPSRKRHISIVGGENTRESSCRCRHRAD